jgi:uncharacterized membrane protein YhaH (DUF805 family)
MGVWQKLFGFEGRLRRRDYWLLSFAITVVFLVVYVAAALSLGIEPGDDHDTRGLGLRFVGALLLLWPSLAIAVKRLHDRGQSGWWWLISLIPLVGSIWTLVNLGILDGTAGQNRYGPSPKQPEVDAEVFA